MATLTVISAAMAPRSCRPRCQNHASNCSIGMTKAQANTSRHQPLAANALMPRKAMPAPMAGRAMGKATRQKACSGDSPNTRAASIKPLPWARKAVRASR
ncbi:hypothetical protein WR25_01632 [Diploscapter pachys]|uniref:Uncharacterized protein n=1 Tax=Diploscapter pachys TaxID=2018661 RepID=A0A2A2KD11_9BILA|nr:hypothetical protein WR25_01632 [Diploscapter pachys]